VIAFHRVTESALASDADDLFERITLDGGRRLTMQPYGVGKMAGGFVPLITLDELKKSLLDENIKAGGLREIRALLLQKLDDQAAEAWRRWKQMAKKRNGGIFEQFEKRLHAANGEPNNVELIFTKDGLRPGGTSLFDAFEWRAVS
jgi:hypothetical protein